MSNYRNLGPPALSAGGTIPPMVFVKGNGSTIGSVVKAGAGDAVVGVSQQGQKEFPGSLGGNTAIAAQSGDPIDILGPGDVAAITIGATITPWQWVKSDANGAAVPHTTGSAFVAGYVVIGGVTTTTGKIFIWPGYITLP